MGLPRLLYLGFALPPGMQGLRPALNPAGHLFETQMVRALQTHFDIKSVGLLPFAIQAWPFPLDASPGLAHALCLVEKAPELFHRWRSLRRLISACQSWEQCGWRPDAVLVYNLSPVYNGFIHWLRKRNQSARRILLLADSPHLGREIPRFKRWRYRLKPFVTPDDQMLGCFHGGIGLSSATKAYFATRDIPWLWMPGGCARDTSAAVDCSALYPTAGESGGAAAPLPAANSALTRGEEGDAEIIFGYFGALAPHTGVMSLVENFLACPLPNPLRICGYGKLAGPLQAIAARERRVQFYGLLPTPQDCLHFAQQCDVLVNPRPSAGGNENNFPSKIFQYAMAGRAILTSRLSGVEAVLGPAGYYFDENCFDPSLREALTALATTSRRELRQRGMAVRHEILANFTWKNQAVRMAAFINELSAPPQRQG